MDEEIKRFLDFYAAHTAGGQRLLIDGGLMFSEGCEGEPGGCCSRSYEFADLVDVLIELSGHKPPMEATGG